MNWACGRMGNPFGKSVAVIVKPGSRLLAMTVVVAAAVLVLRGVGVDDGTVAVAVRCSGVLPGSGVLVDGRTLTRFVAAIPQAESVSAVSSKTKMAA